MATPSIPSELAAPVKGYIQIVVDYINAVLSSLAPEGEVYIVGLAALLISYSIKHKYNWGKAGFVLMAVIVFTSLRYFGVGGA